MDRYHSKHVGVGGIKCPCCAAKGAKILVNREIRRKAKQTIRINGIYDARIVNVDCGNRINW